MKASWIFDIHDLWIGVFWRREPIGGWLIDSGRFGHRAVREERVTLYICVLPMLPVRIEWRRWRKQPITPTPAEAVRLLERTRRKR